MWGVTKTADCYGLEAEGLDSWCVYDLEEDDPPIVEGIYDRLVADYVCDALNLYDSLLPTVQEPW